MSVSGNWAVAILALLGGGCATPMDSGSQCTVGPGFLDDQRTFTWRMDPAVTLDDVTGFVSPLVVQSLERAVIAELGTRGLEFVERRDTGEADDQWTDLEIAITLKTRREVVCMTADGFPCGVDDCRDCVDLNFPAEMHMTSVGFLAADVYYLGTPIWRGWVERDLYPGDRDRTDAVIAEAVPMLFESFPP